MRKKPGPKPGKKMPPSPIARDPSPESGVEALTQREVAERLGRTTGWVRELTQRGTLSRLPGGKYPWPRVREEYEAYCAAGNQGPSDADTLRAEQVRLTREKADKAAMENEVLRGSLVTVDASSSVVLAVLRSVDATLRTAKRRLGPGLAARFGLTAAQGMQVVEEATESARAEILRALTELGPTDTEQDAA